jgi:hypothetical protein
MDALPIEVILDHLKIIYEDTIPFNKYLGLKIDSISTEGVLIAVGTSTYIVG